MDAFRPAFRKQGVSKGGLIEIQGPNGQHETHQTYTCCHCNKVFRVPENPAEMGFCTKCHHRECIGCAKKLNGRCAPFESQLKKWEDRDRLLRSIG